MPTLKETEGSLSYVQCFLSWVFFDKCLFFILHVWIPSGQTLYIVKKTFGIYNSNSEKETRIFIMITAALAEDVKQTIFYLVWEVKRRKCFSTY